MNNRQPYTEEDIQAYAAGNFTGDAAEFKKQMEADRSLQEDVALYQHLFTGIRQQPQPRLSFDLAGAVLQKIPAGKQKPIIKIPGTWSIAFIALIIICSCFPLLSQYFIVADVGTTVIAGCMIFLFVTIFHWAEYRRKSSLYARVI